jgi:1-deoxy-D-xylulose-5-phosphate reductoisomerase
MPCVLNAADEIAVDAFLKGIIRFTEIPVVIKETMDKHVAGPDTELHVITEADRWARRTAERVIKTLS